MRIQHWVTIIGLAGCALLSGCATSGFRQAGKTALSLDLAQEEIRSAKGQLTATFNALDTIMNSAVGDLRPLFKEYSRELSSLEVTAENARRRALKFRDESVAYFAAWASNIDQITDPALKQQAIQRRGKAIAAYQGIEKSLREVGEGYAPVVTVLNDVKTTLGTDLTASNVAATKPAYLKARNQAMALQKLMDESASLMSGAVDKLAPLGSSY